MRRSYQITRVAELETLSEFRMLIKQAAQEANSRGIAIDQQTIYDLQLAVDEAATNICTHGYAGMDAGSIILDLAIDERQAQIVITDFGHSFEPASAPTPDVEAALEDRPVGGFGLFFIYESMDEVNYEANACGNRLILIKNLT